jgi:hypothetical protein
MLEGHLRSVAGEPPAIGETVSLRVDPAGVVFLP